MKSLDWALIQYDWCPYKKILGFKYAQREDHVKIHGEDGHLQAEKGLQKKSTLPTLDLGLLASRIMRK